MPLVPVLLFQNETILSFVSSAFDQLCITHFHLTISPQSIRSIHYGVSVFKIGKELIKKIKSLSMSY